MGGGRAECVSFILLYHAKNCLLTLKSRRYPRDSNGWEFGTMRGREWHPSGYDDDEREESYQSTVRPPQAQLPSSLRAIFEDETAPQPDPWRIGSQRDAPTPRPPSIAPSLAAPAGPRERRDRRQNSADSMTTPLAADDDSNGSGFVFPPRSRPQGRKPPVDHKRPPPISADEDVPRESILDLRLLSGYSEEPDTSLDTITPPARKQIPPSARENRPFKVPPNIEVPPHDSIVGVDRQKSAGPGTPGSGSTDNSNTPQSSRQFVNRQRSQSNADSISSRRAGWATGGEDINLASPAAFQFPPNGKGDQTPSPSQKSYARGEAEQPTKVVSPGQGSPAHQATYSLDTNSRRLGPELRSPPPSMGRTRSATTLPEGPTAAPPESPLIPPIKPFARMGRERSGSGSDSSAIASMGTPGLKDVLKVSFMGFVCVSSYSLVLYADTFHFLGAARNGGSFTTVTFSRRALSPRVLPDSKQPGQHYHCSGSKPIFPRCCLGGL